MTRRRTARVVGLKASKPTRSRKLSESEALPESLQRLITALAEQAVREFLEEERTRREAQE